MKIKAVIIEDEFLAMETLELYLGKYCPEVEVVAKASDAREAIKMINENSFDLAFLDIELPYGNAFDLLEEVGDIPFEIVFITAYENYAVKAFNSDAVHYILKPLEIEELIKAVQKVKSTLEKKQEIVLPKEEITVKDYRLLQQKKFIFPSVYGFDLIVISDIIYCSADNNYTAIFLKDGSKKLISKTLKKVEEQLLPFGFYRTHKKYLVNLNDIVSYQKGKTAKLIMSDQSEISIAPSKKTDLIKLLSS